MATKSVAKPVRRFILLRMRYESGEYGWLIFDRLRYRICDGVYGPREMAQEVADSFERDPEAGDRDWYAEERSIYMHRSWDQWKYDHGYE